VRAKQRLRSSKSFWSQLVTQLAAARLDALRSLRAAYPDAEIAIIGATALAFHIDMTWRTSVDLDLVTAVAAADLDPSRLPGWKDLKDIAHILNEYPSLDDDGLFSDELRAMRLELGPARAFVLGLRLRDIVYERDREVVDAFFRTIAEDVHWTRFVENSPWRHDEDDLRKKVDALRSGLDAESDAD
jgi:hypothetical protein